MDPSRRKFLGTAAVGGLISAMGWWFFFDDEATSRARAQTLSDGRPRLPPGQRVISALRPMGGEPGDASARNFRLRVHGEVEAPFQLDFAGLLAMQQETKRVDVHCVTRWTVLDAQFKGVPIAKLAERARVKSSARFVIIEAAHGYTSNIRIADALMPTSMIVHELNGRPLPHTHGGPARALIPQFYFWKSAKWITGLRFATADQPGYWETRGYHNHANPWREERYSRG